MYGSHTQAKCAEQARSGGSLIEVAIALVLLAVGLLALQALALAAGWSVGAAARTTRNAHLAEELAEATSRALAMDSIPPDLDCPLPDGGRLIRVVRAGGTHAVQYHVAVTPPAHLAVGRGSEVSGYAFSMDGFAPSEALASCP